MRQALLVTLLAAAISGCAEPAPLPPEPTGQIDGAVLDNLMQPFSGQPVYLMALGLRDDSSPLGGFTFRNVPVGQYALLSSRDGYRSASAIVDVEEDTITRVILQLAPIPLPDPYFVTIAHRGTQDLTVPGDECPSCAWSIPINGSPKEIILDAHWTQGTPFNSAELDFEVKDSLGMSLYHDQGTSPMRISIMGDDLRPEAKSLNVTVKFSHDFTTQTRFSLDEAATYYYGATHHELFYV